MSNEEEWERQQEQREKELAGRDTMTMNELAGDVWEYRPKVAGFTIGRGKRVYKFFNPSERGPYYCCWADDHRGGEGLGWPRYIKATQEVTIVYETE